MNGLVLSLFPGIGLLDMAFEAEGFCVVRGPDILWGGDIRRFHPPAGRFDGVIGGPPCQPFSNLRHLLKAMGRDTKVKDLIPEFVRCIEDALPRWFVMENVKAAPSPSPGGYTVAMEDLRDNVLGGLTKRRRRIWFGARGSAIWRPDVKAVCDPSLLPPECAVTRNARIPDTPAAKRAARKDGGMLPGQGRYMPIPDVCELQGLPRTYFDDTPFLQESVRLMLGNGVPMAMGRAIARAVKEAMEPFEALTE